MPHSYPYFSDDVQETVALNRPALEGLPINIKTAKILRNTEFLLLDANNFEMATYLTTLREMVVAEIEIARIFNDRPSRISMKCLVDIANDKAARKQMPGI